MVVCPGCGARCPSTAHTCDWCGRPFYDERRRLPFPWMAPAIVGLVVMLLSGIVVISLLGARQSPSRTGEQAIAPPPMESVPILESPAEQVESAVVEPTASVPLTVEATVAPPTTAVPTPISPPASTAASTTPIFLRIANTDRQGAYIRREPRAGAPGIVALRDGIVVQVVGPDVTVDGRVWRNVSDGKGAAGWTPAQYLESSPTGF